MSNSNENSDEAIELTVAVVKGVVGAIPWVGALIAEVGSVYLNPLEKRRKQWAETVMSALAEIEKRFERTAQDLQNDDEFISFLYHSTISALKNHREEKVEALKQALISSAAPSEISSDIKFQYLSYIDNLTVTHILILRCLEDHSQSVVRIDNMEEIYDLVTRRASVQISRAEFRALLNDLDVKFLIRIGDIAELAEYASGKSLRLLEKSKVNPLEVTSVGRGFLAYITGAMPQPLAAAL